MTLAAQQEANLWEAHIYGLLDIGIPEKTARSMIGWARKREASYRDVERAICNLKRRPPPDPAKPWGFWWVEFRES